MRGRKRRSTPRKFARKDHKSRQFPDHESLLNHVIENPAKFEIPPAKLVEKEVDVKEAATHFQPDALFHHPDGSVTVVEVSTSPYRRKQEDEIMKFRTAKTYFNGLGVECNCLRVFLINGKPKFERPVEFLLDDIDKRRY